MSTKNNTPIPEVLKRQLNLEGYELVDAIAVPSRGDRMVRVQTLEEALEDLEHSGLGETTSYLIQVRPKKESLQEPVQFTDLGHSKSTLEGIYLHDGKLNLPYLLKNAEVLFSSGDYVLARHIYKTILASGERSANALFWIAKCYEAEGKFNEAQTHYEESIAYHPSLEAYQNLAALLVQYKKHQQAAELLERSLNLKHLSSSTRVEILSIAGNCWLEAKVLERAEKCYRKALEINPLSDRILASLGALFLDSGRTVEAKRVFEEAVAINSRSDKALFGLGSCHYAEGDKRTAHDYFVRSLGIKIQNPVAIFNLVKCAYEIRSYASAAKIVSEYVQVAPVNANLLYSLAGLHFHLGRITEAHATAKKVLEIQPGHSGAMDLLRMIDRFTGVTV